MTSRCQSNIGKSGHPRSGRAPKLNFRPQPDLDEAVDGFGTLPNAITISRRVGWHRWAQQEEEFPPGAQQHIRPPNFGALDGADQFAAHWRLLPGLLAFCSLSVELEQTHST